MANEFKIKKGLIVTGASGGTVVDIQGSQGQLFSVTDDLSGSIFAVSDISGVPILDVNSSGLSTFDGNVNLPDNKKILLGTGNDLEIYHDASHSYIKDIGVGDLKISSNTVRIESNAAENMIIAIANGGVSSYYNNVKKFETTNTGVTVTGGATILGTNTLLIESNSTAATFNLNSTARGFDFINNNGTLLSIDNDGNGTFADQAFSAATSSGDASSTLTTKGYVDGLITGATIYRGAWDPSGGGYGSPDLSGVTQTSGYYYICSAAGTAEPNGTGCEPDSWETGDWVIWNDDIVDCAGTGTGGWQKIDNSSVLSGVGTGQTVALWEGASSVTDSETLGNAPITVSGNNATFAGIVTGTSFTSSTDTGISINGITMTRVAANSAIRVSNGLETLGLLRSYAGLVVGTSATIGSSTQGNTLTISSAQGSRNTKFLSAGNGGYVQYESANDGIYGYIGSGSHLLSPVVNDNDFVLRAQGEFAVSIGATEKMRINSSGNATFAGTVTAVDLLTVNGDGHLFLGADGETPKIDMMYDDHASGAGWDTRIFTGKTDDLPNGQSFPTSTIAGGYGTQYQANSDGAFFGIIPYTAGHFRPIINWGDDAADTPFSFQFNGTNIVNISYAGTVSAPIFDGDHKGTINTATTGVTQTAGNNSTLIATTAYADAAAGAIPIGNYLPLSAGSSYPLTGDLWLDDNSGASPSLYLQNGSNNYWRLINGSTGIFSLKEGTSDRITILPGGNVGIGTTGPGRKLDVAGITKTIGFQNTNNYVEGFLSANFANGVANQNYDIQLGNISFWGYIEVEITGTYSNQNTAGKLTKIYAIGVNPATASAAGIIYTNETRVSDSIGTIKDNIALGDFRFDGTDNTGVFAIRVSHIVSTGNGYTIKVRVFTHGSNGSQGAAGILTNLNLSSIYTQTALSRQYVYYNNNVGIGTTNPSSLLSLRKDVAGGDVAIYLQNYNSVVGSTDETVSIKFAHGNDGGSGYVGAKIVGGKEGDFESSPANVKGFMSFYTNEGSLTSQVEQMRINGDGNVGIGTSTPNAKLDIQGTQGQLFSVTDDLSGDIFSVADISGVPIMNVNSDGTSYFDGKVEIGTATVAAANTAADDLWLRSTGSNGITISSGNAQTGTIFFGDVANAAVAGFRYNHNTGDMAISAEDNITFACDNVGIGTTSPGQKLDVVGGFIRSISTGANLVQGAFVAQSSTTDSPGYRGQGYFTYNEELDVSWYMGTPYTNGDMFSINRQNTTTSFDTGAANMNGTNVDNFFAIKNNGNVGIGTTNPDEKLDIVGKQIFSATGSSYYGNPAAFNTASNGDKIIFYNDGTSYDGRIGVGSASNLWLKSYGETANEGDIEFYAGGSQRAIVKGSGNVGIGINNPSALLEVRKGSISGQIAKFSAINAHVVIESSTAGNAVLHLKPNTTGSKFGQFKVTAGNGYGFSWSNDAAGTGETTYMDLDTSSTGGGDLTVKGDVIAYGSPSDKKYKENIKPIESALDKAMQLQGVTFDWKDSDSILDIKEDIGFIAQDVQEVLPELVRDNGKGNLSLRYQGITPILLEAIKELKAEIEELKKQIK